MLRFRGVGWDKQHRRSKYVPRAPADVEGFANAVGAAIQPTRPHIVAALAAVLGPIAERTQMDRLNEEEQALQDMRREVRAMRRMRSLLHVAAERQIVSRRLCWVFSAAFRSL